MDKVNLAWGKVLDPATLESQPTVHARGAITQVPDREGGTRPITQSPLECRKRRARSCAPSR